MTWLALADHEERRFAPRGLGIDKQAEPQIAGDPETLLTRGTLMFETRLSAHERPQVLFGFKSTAPSARNLTFQAIPGGGITMVHAVGPAVTHAAIERVDAGRADVVRIIYAWDCATNFGRLTLEKPEDWTSISVPIDTPNPLSVGDIRALMLGQGAHAFAPDMIFAALGDHIEPIGPKPTLLTSTPIDTPWGYTQLWDLNRGDTVHSHLDGVVPVLHKVTHRVCARQLQAYPPARPLFRVASRCDCQPRATLAD